MSAPEKIEVNRHNGWRDGYKTIVNDDDFGDIVFEDTHYIRQDIHEATLAERDKENAELKQEANRSLKSSIALLGRCQEKDATITELRAALNEAALLIENHHSLAIFQAQEFANKYRAIAKDIK